MGLLSVGNKVVRGLLDMDKPSRMARAKEQGFDTDKKVYHGTADDFDAFDPDRSIGTQFWSTTNKAEIESGDVGAQGSGVIKEMYHKIKNPAGWEEYDKFGIDELIREGYDGLKLPDGKGDYTYVAFDPSQYRSVDAVFDPAKTSSSNLLASNPVATAAAGAGGLLAMTGSEDSEAGVVSKFTRSLFGMLDAGKKSGEVVNYPDEWIEQVPYELRKEVALHNEGILGSSYREGMEASPTYYHGTTDFGLDEISKSGFNPSQSGLMGEGVYLTPSKQYAAKYGSRFHNYTNDSLPDIGQMVGKDKKLVIPTKVKDGGITDTKFKGKEVIVPDVSSLRSTNAVFDPAKASSSNLLASNPVATASAGLLANVTGQPSNLSSYMQGNTDAYLTSAERQYLQNKQSFESNFSDDTGWDRADILPFRVNEQTGEREFATPEMIKGLLSGLYDIGQSKNTKINNPASLLELI